MDLRPVKASDWDTVLAFCRSRDVEEGESDDFMYSVRQSTGTLTIWTQRGWREGWYVARIVPEKQGVKRKLHLELGTAPPERIWASSKVEMHLRELFSRLVPGMKPL